MVIYRLSDSCVAQYAASLVAGRQSDVMAEEAS